MTDFLPHRVALDENGERRCIGEITNKNRHDHTFYCIGCGEKMVPVLCGPGRASHFRHFIEGAEQRCSHETALHNFAKREIAERFEKNEKFEVGYYIQNDCPLVETCQIYKRVRKRDKCSGYALRTFDLKKEYDTCEIEGSYNGYRADVLLTNSQNPDVRPIFLEISVSHDCSPEKIEAGCQIIELKITHENDLNRPIVETRDGVNGPVRFYNFEWVKHLSDTFVFDRMLLINGKFYKQTGVVCGEMDTRRPSETQFEVSVIQDTRRPNLRTLKDLHKLALSQAFLYKEPITRCSFCGAYKRCRYQRPEDEKIIFCYYKNGTGSAIDNNDPSSTCRNWRVDEWKCMRICESFPSSDVYVWTYERTNEYLPMKKGFSL